ncbi:hypothetical protein PQX77_002775 [Marasmius sp. AFHP31]|nr:hypothetical protein PQX77_002775 [Marasmius sp. AFHP31]
MVGGLVFDFENTFGALALTAFVSSFLTGITTIQTYIYIVNYKKDPLQTKGFVAIVWTLAMLHAILLMVTTWHYLVKSFGNPLLILKIHWSSLAALTVSSTQIMIAQLFLARRVHSWALSSQHGAHHLGSHYSSVKLHIVICILGNFFASLSGVIKISVLNNVSEILQIRTNLLITLAFNITVDTLLTALLAWSLLNSKSGNKRSDRVIQWIVLCSINTGLLPSLSAMAGLILFLRSPNTFWFLFCVYLISDTYANSILANLNSRSFFKEKMLSPQRTPGSQGLGLSASILPSAFQVTTTRTSTDVEDLEMGVIATKSRIQEIEGSSGPESETVSAQGRYLSAYRMSNTPRRTISPS